MLVLWIEVSDKPRSDHTTAALVDTPETGVPSLAQVVAGIGDSPNRSTVTARMPTGLEAKAVRIVGRVWDRRSGDPHPLGVVTLFFFHVSGDATGARRHGTRQQAPAGEDGRFVLEFTPEPEEHWVLEISGPGAFPRRQTLEDRRIRQSDAVIDLGDIWLEPGGVVHGRLRASPPDAVGPAWVGLFSDRVWIDPGAQQGAGCWLSADTQILELRPGELVRRDRTLRRESLIVRLIRASDSVPLAGQPLRVLPPDLPVSLVPLLLTDRDGAVRSMQLLPGAWRVMTPAGEEILAATNLDVGPDGIVVIRR